MGYAKSHKNLGITRQYPRVAREVIGLKPGEKRTFVCKDNAEAKRIRFQLYNFLHGFCDTSKEMRPKMSVRGKQLIVVVPSNDDHIEILNEDDAWAKSQL